MGDLDKKGRPSNPAPPRPTGTVVRSESLWRCIRDVLRAALWLVSGFEGGPAAAVFGEDLIWGT